MKRYRFPRVVLVCCWLVSQIGLVGAKIVLYDADGLSLEFQDVPASFGARIPDQGITGRLYLAEPDIFACSDLNISVPTGKTQNEDIPIVILASRSFPNHPQGCSFSEKARYAAKAGAAAVLVYDFAEEPLFHMLPDPKMDGAADDQEEDIYESSSAPAALITRRAGDKMITVLNHLSKTSDPAPLLYIDSGEGGAILYDSSLDGSVTGFASSFLILVLISGSLFLLRTLHPSQQHRRRRPAPGGASAPLRRLLSKEEFARLPEVELVAGGASTAAWGLEEGDADPRARWPFAEPEGDPCPVCLEELAAGDRAVRLPCGHLFHQPCIKPWLTERQDTCPLCKREARGAGGGGGGGGGGGPGEGAAGGDAGGVVEGAQGPRLAGEEEEGAEQPLLGTSGGDGVDVEGGGAGDVPPAAERQGRRYRRPSASHLLRASPITVWMGGLWGRGGAFIFRGDRHMVQANASSGGRRGEEEDEEEAVSLLSAEQAVQQEDEEEKIDDEVLPPHQQNLSPRLPSITASPSSSSQSLTV